MALGLRLSCLRLTSDLSNLKVVVLSRTATLIAWTEVFSRSCAASNI